MSSGSNRTPIAAGLVAGLVAGALGGYLVSPPAGEPPPADSLGLPVVTTRDSDAREALRTLGQTVDAIDRRVKLMESDLSDLRTRSAAAVKGPAQPEAPAKPAVPPSRPAPAAQRPEVAEFLRRLASARADQKWQMLAALKKHPDIGVLQTLRALATGYEHDVPSMKAQVRAAAVDALGGMRSDADPSLARAAMQACITACEDRWCRETPQGDAVIRNAIKSIGELRVASSLGFLCGMIANRNTYWSEEAMRATEKLRMREAIPLLIEEWRRSEEAGRVPNASDTARERRQVLGEAAGSTLAELTGQQFERASDWARWWSEHSGSFEIPPAEDDGF